VPLSPEQSTKINDWIKRNKAECAICGTPTWIGLEIVQLPVEAAEPLDLRLVSMKCSKCSAVILCSARDVGL
jgi:hypothetical protein